MLDTWVRVSLPELMRTSPTHLYSAFDNEATDLACAANLPQSGYTEWTAPGPRTLSFSWDWHWEPEAGRMMADWHNLRTNLQLVDESGCELPVTATHHCVAQLMEQAHWAEATRLALALNVRHGEAFGC